MSYEAAMQRLLATGWKQGDPIPDWFIEQSPGVEAGYPEGSPQNPMQLSTMTVTGTPPGQQGEQEDVGGAGQALAPPSIYEGMSDEDIARFGGMGDLRRQLAEAEALRDTESAQGRYINQGRTFVAANPLEHLVVGLKRRKGRKEAKRIGEEQTEGRTAIIELLRNRNRRDFDETNMDVNFDPERTRGLA